MRTGDHHRVGILSAAIAVLVVGRIGQRERGKRAHARAMATDRRKRVGAVKVLVVAGVDVGRKIVVSIGAVGKVKIASTDVEIVLLVIK